MTVAANIAAVATAIGLWVFVAVYLTRPWRETAEGRALMYRSMAFGAAMALVAVNIWFPNYPWRAEIRLVMYWLLAFTTWRLVFVLVRSRDRDT